MNDGKPSLDEILARINSASDDFAALPARSPNDCGAFNDYPLHKVATWGDVVAADVLLANNAKINAKGEDDDTPLHRAIAADRLEMVRFLLAKGARTDVLNRYGDSASDDAGRSINPAIRELFSGSKQ